MKAIVLREKGGPNSVSFEEVAVPTPQAGEVLIRLKYAAFESARSVDFLRSFPRLQLPTILGSDGAGQVDAIGEGVTGVRVGDHVLIDPGLNWETKNALMDPDYTILGMPQDENVPIRRRSR